MVLVVVDALVAGAAGVVGAVGLVEEELVTLPVAAQLVEVPVVVPASVGAPVGDVVVVVTVSVAVTVGVGVGVGTGVGAGVGLVPVLEVDGLVVDSPGVDVTGRFGYTG